MGRTKEQIGDKVDIVIGDNIVSQREQNTELCLNCGAQASETRGIPSARQKGRGSGEESRFSQNYEFVNSEVKGNSGFSL